jgi:hypothetical protein
VPSDCANWGNFWDRFAKLLTVCNQSAVPLFCSKLHNYIVAAVTWSLLCTAFCSCLYYAHNSACSCDAYRKSSFDWCVWSQCHVVCWCSNIIIIIIIIPFHAIVPLDHSCSLSTLNLPLSLFFLHALSESELRYVFLHPLFSSVQLQSIPLTLPSPQSIFNCCQIGFISAACVCVCVWLCIPS